MLIISLNRAQGNVFSLCVSTAPTSSVLWLWIITIRTLSTPSPFFTSSLSPHILFSTPWCVCMCINAPENHHHLCCLFPCVCCICMLLNLHVGLPEALRYSWQCCFSCGGTCWQRLLIALIRQYKAQMMRGIMNRGDRTQMSHMVSSWIREKSENTWLELSNYWRWFQVFQG